MISTVTLMWENTHFHVFSEKVNVHFLLSSISTAMLLKDGMNGGKEKHQQSDFTSPSVPELNNKSITNGLCMQSVCTHQCKQKHKSTQMNNDLSSACVYVFARDAACLFPACRPTPLMQTCRQAQPLRAITHHCVCVFWRVLANCLTSHSVAALLLKL